MTPFYANMQQVKMPLPPAGEPLLVLPQGKAVDVSGFRAVKTGAAARQATTVALAWDACGLEVVFSCMDCDIVAEQHGPENIKLWKDDCIYLWLDLGHSHNEQQRFLMIQVSAGNALCVQRNGSFIAVLDGLTTRIERVAGGWTATLRLSWQGLGVHAPAGGEVWGFNLTRMDQPGAYDFENMEMSSLAVLPAGDLSALDAWGHLLFTRVPEDEVTGRQAMEKTHDSTIDRLGVGYYRELVRNRRIDEALDARRGMPANPRSTPDTYKVLRYLTDLTERHDKRFLLAQDIWSYTGGMDDGFERFVARLAEQTGKWLPMLHVSYPDSSLDADNAGRICADANRHAIAYWQAGGLVTIHTNPNNPWVGGMSLEQREKIANVLEVGTPENLAWTRTLDALASHLTVLRDAGVVVLWRPLHEMTFTNCYWYDCGATPDREVFKDLWRYMFRYMTYEKGLDNLLWVYSTSDVGSWGGPAPDCVYPGGDYVDVVGISLYGNSVEIDGGAYEKLVTLGKPFAFSEFGPGHHGGATGMKEDHADAFDNLTLIRQVREKYPRTIYAAYWHSWTGAEMAIIDNPHADQLVNDPWVADRSDVNWQAIDIPNLDAQRRRTIQHKAFDYPDMLRVP